jgi:hypothetical protein
VAGALALGLALWAVPSPSGAADRLDRFRDLAAARLGLAQMASDAAAASLADLYAVVDEEIVDSLQSGDPFASVPFIQEQLDGFSAAWGGASFRVTRLPGGPGQAPLTVGIFAVAGVAGSGSLRVYGTGGLSKTVSHDGAPDIVEWPPSRSGSAQFLATWVGPPSGSGTRPLRAEVWRRRGAEDVERSWSTTSVFPDGLSVSDFATRPGELSLRYELRYPGWKPGCDGQTEHEDVYRWSPAGETLTLARRQVINAWHRDLQLTVSRFFTALAKGDGPRLTELVPDARVRSRLPVSLRPEPACEAQSPDTPGTVVVAATDERLVADARPSALPTLVARAPWSLWWSRAPSGAWRLAGASPVLQ